MKRAGILIGIFVAVIALILVATARNTLEPMQIIPLPEADAVIGQNLIVGIRGTTLASNTNIPFLEAVKPGGVVLYKKNIGTPEELKQLIADLQQVALRTTGRKYLIMTDEEADGATRLDIFKNVFDTGEPDWKIVEKDSAFIHEMGINMILGPLADYVFDEDAGVAHRTPYRDERGLKEFNRGMISILKKNEVAATLKHFPGLGMISADTHAEIGRTDAPTTTIMRAIAIFKDGIDAGADFVMTDHGIYSSIDPHRSASISPIVVGMLRSQLGFKGIIITDDVTNMPVGSPTQISINSATKDALLAGNTMVMFSNGRVPTQQAFEMLSKSYASDPRLKEVVDDNYRRIVSYKDKNLPVK